MNKQHFRNLIMLFNTAFALLFCNKSTCQNIESIKYLKQLFAYSDSIVLISHDITEEYAPKIIPDWDSRDTSMNIEKWKAFHPALPKFLIIGKLNKQIIQESVSLGDSGRTRLSKILLRQVNLKYWAPARCFQPQHSVIFYKGNTQSYIDICFGCNKIHSSKDIAFDEINVDARKWKELIAFFKLNGLNKVFEEEDKRFSN